MNFKKEDLNVITPSNLTFQNCPKRDLWDSMPPDYIEKSAPEVDKYFGKDGITEEQRDKSIGLSQNQIPLNVNNEKLHEFQIF